MLIAARTPPNLSVLNPIERVNSTLNIGLNGLALGRKELDPETEKRIKSLTSKKAWRNANKPFQEGLKESIDYKQIVHRTTKDCHRIIKERFSSLQYKGGL